MCPRTWSSGIHYSEDTQLAASPIGALDLNAKSKGLFQKDVRSNSSQKKKKKGLKAHDTAGHYFSVKRVLDLL